MKLFKRKRVDVVAAQGQAAAQAAPFGEMTVDELIAYNTRRRAELDEVIQEAKQELAAIRVVIDRKVAQARFEDMLDALPEHEVDVLAGLLIEED